MAAPVSIQVRSLVTATSGRRSPLGGIMCFGSVEVTILISRLSALLPRTKSGSPESLPFKIPSTESSRNPFFCVSSPWQSKQLFSKSGRMS